MECKDDKKGKLTFRIKRQLPFKKVIALLYKFIISSLNNLKEGNIINV